MSATTIIKTRLIIIVVIIVLKFPRRWAFWWWVVGSTRKCFDIRLFAAHQTAGWLLVLCSADMLRQDKPCQDKPCQDNHDCAEPQSHLVRSALCRVLLNCSTISQVSMSLRWCDSNAIHPETLSCLHQKRQLDLTRKKQQISTTAAIEKPVQIIVLNHEELTARSVQEECPCRRYILWFNRLTD